MKTARLLLLLVALYLLAGWLGTKWEVAQISLFSLFYGIYLFIGFIESFGKKLPYFEMTFALFGVQLLIAPFLEYYYFHNEIFGVMLVDEIKYFSFVTWAIVAIHIGFTIIKKLEIEQTAKKQLVANKHVYEKLGLWLIAIGYFFFFLSLVSSNFIFTTFAFFRFIGSLYLWFSESSKRYLYFCLVWIPFFMLVIKSAVFINLFIWIGIVFFIWMLNKKPNRLPLYSTIIVSFFLVTVLQSVKHVYRDAVWRGKGDVNVTMGGLMKDQILNTDAKLFKIMGSGLNIRVNQGWIISHGMKNLPEAKHDFEASYLKKELIGILLPRFLYPNKVSVGSHEKFDLFVGWHLDEGTAMNLGIIGDWYFNFGKEKGIIAALFLGLLFGVMHRYYLQKAVLYPDLILWTTLFYFTIMRAGNEFYMIMNWYVKTGLITVLFFMYLRPLILSLPTQKNTSFKKILPEFDPS